MRDKLLNGELSAVVQPFSVSASLTDSQPMLHLFSSPGLPDAAVEQPPTNRQAIPASQWPAYLEGLVGPD